MHAAEQHDAVAFEQSHRRPGRRQQRLGEAASVPSVGDTRPEPDGPRRIQHGAVARVPGKLEVGWQRETEVDHGVEPVGPVALMDDEPQFVVPADGLDPSGGLAGVVVVAVPEPPAGVGQSREERRQRRRVLGVQGPEGERVARQGQPSRQWGRIDGESSENRQHSTTLSHGHVGVHPVCHQPSPSA
ncbi:hypothetical protein [Catellatospora sp. NPDC049133]|uniref:hypothetical protein n=1 Tax=Catellatospora sp. NPDC049133 TaxID=3155499 RepID=UPI0033DBEED7